MPAKRRARSPSTSRPRRSGAPTSPPTSRQLLEETGLDPSLLCLELTESLLADHTEGQVRAGAGAAERAWRDACARRFRHRLLLAGLPQAIAVQKLKIDRIFISGATQSVHARELLSGIIALTRGLNMTVVAEGAERPRKSTCCKRNGLRQRAGLRLCQAAIADEAMAFAHRHERDILGTIPRPQPLPQIPKRSSAA